MAVIENVELWWVKCDPEDPVKNDDDDKPDYWEVQVRTTDKEKALHWKKNNVRFKPLKRIVRDDKGEKVLDEMNEPVRENVLDEDTGLPYFAVTLRRKVTKANGKEMPPVSVRGGMDTLDPNIIGNKTIGNVSIFQYDYVYKGEEGIATMLKGIQAVKLVKFEKTGGDDEFKPVEMEIVGGGNIDDINETPSAKTPVKGKSKAKAKEEDFDDDNMDDEIPFN